jgi:hypothetical protein
MVTPPKTSQRRIVRHVSTIVACVSAFASTGRPCATQAVATYTTLVSIGGKMLVCAGVDPIADQ